MPAQLTTIRGAPPREVRGPREGRLDSRRVADIRRHRDPADLGGDPCRLGFAAVEHRDAGAEIGEPPGGGLAEAAAGPGHKSDGSRDLHRPRPQARTGARWARRRAMRATVARPQSATMGRIV